MSVSYRTLWLSDIHLGTHASRAGDLLNFLAEVSADKIFLNGDIIDLERMKTRTVFTNAQRQVVARLLQLAKSGTEIVYIPGNHDIELRGLAGRDIQGIPVVREASHVTGDGKRFLVTHGDLFDHSIRLGSNLSRFGASAYRFLVRTDVLVNKLGSRLGCDYFAISSRIKSRLSSANEYIRRFELLAAKHAADRQFDGIVCGHIHRPCVRYIGDICYANDGDWVEHRTALAELDDGRLQILQWQANGSVLQFDSLAAPLAA